MDDVKKREEEIRRQIHEVLDLVLDINGLQESNKDETGDHPTAFFEFNGHVGNMRVYVFENGWIENADSGIKLESSVFHDFRFAPQSVVDGLKNFMNRGVPDGSD